MRSHCFTLTEACTSRLELADFAGKRSKNTLVCKNAVAVAYYGSCRLLVMGSCPISLVRAHPKTYGLRPRLWLLIGAISFVFYFRRVAEFFGRVFVLTGIFIRGRVINASAEGASLSGGMRPPENFEI